MLVLTRKPGEGIIIGDSVTIRIIEVKSGSIRIGIASNAAWYQARIASRPWTGGDVTGSRSTASSA